MRKSEENKEGERETRKGGKERKKRKDEKRGGIERRKRGGEEERGNSFVFPSSSSTLQEDGNDP
jgi:hypothetical protein